MTRRNRLLAILLAMVLALALIGGAAAEKKGTGDGGLNAAERYLRPRVVTDGNDAVDEPEAAEESEATDEPEAVEEPRPDTTLVCTTSAFSGAFSPFFYDTDADSDVVELVSLTLLGWDRSGAMVTDGISGEALAFDGTPYAYQGAGSVEIVLNDDGTADYNFTMRDDIVFSDGTPATIDDVIFGLYVTCDPTYDGSEETSTLPIEGLKAYRDGMQSRGSAILEDGEGDGYVANDLYTEDQYNAFWTYYNEEAGAALAQEICDYCVERGYNDPGDSVVACAYSWGYELDEGATAKDFWKAIAASYETVEEAEAAESVGSTRLQLTNAALGAEFQNGVETGKSAPNISGIVRTGDYSMTIHMTEYDVYTSYSLYFLVAPMHYYGDPAQYDYDANRFGFPKGDLSAVKAKSAAPLGTGPYVFDSYEDGVVTLHANPAYFKGEPHVSTLKLVEAEAGDALKGIVEGRYDIAVPTTDGKTLKAIRAANANGELSGETVHTEMVYDVGYGYIGINADLVNVDGKPASDASKALRKGLMTMLAVYRDAAIADYYGERADVIEYPISRLSWAAPAPADADYRRAYSLDIDGNPIYDDAMDEAQRQEAAQDAAVGFFKAAGFTYDEAKGRFTDAKDAYEIMIPGGGKKQHPAFAIADGASKALTKIGITLKVRDVKEDAFQSALQSNEAMLWAAAWSHAGIDPDMSGIYESANAHGMGDNSNCFSIDDAELDALIEAGLASADRAERTRIYRDAMGIVMDWACELPLYQRKNCVLFSAERVELETIPTDMTPYWGWIEAIESIVVKPVAPESETDVE